MLCLIGLAGVHIANAQKIEWKMAADSDFTCDSFDKAFNNQATACDSSQKGWYWSFHFVCSSSVVQATCKGSDAPGATDAQKKAWQSMCELTATGLNNARESCSGSGSFDSRITCNGSKIVATCDTPPPPPPSAACRMGNMSAIGALIMAAVLMLRSYL